MSKISKKWLIFWEFLIFFFFQNSQLFNRREKNRWKPWKFHWEKRSNTFEGHVGKIKRRALVN